MTRRSALALAAVILTAGAPVRAETVEMLSGRPGEPRLAVRHEPGPGPSVVYVHGATFPSALSVAFRIDGMSWMDDLRRRGFDVWAFDFAGYGGSDRPAAMANAAPDAAPIGRAVDTARQIERVAQRIIQATGHKRVIIVAHSWGTIPAGLFAGRRPELVDKFVLFGPVALRRGPGEDPTKGATMLVDRDVQWKSFASGIPGGQPRIAPEQFDRWMAAYLATDPRSSSRTPPSVSVPTGPAIDTEEAWSGRFPYDPSTVRAPTLIVRGEWDTITRDADAAWLVQALRHVPGGAKDVKLPRGGHRMHLEEGRQALFDAVGTFLAPITRPPS